MSSSLTVITSEKSCGPTPDHKFLEPYPMMKTALQKSMERAIFHLTLRYRREILAERMRSKMYYMMCEDLDIDEEALEDARDVQFFNWKLYKI